MNSGHSDSYASLSPSRQVRIAEVPLRFANAWRDGYQPLVEDPLRPVASAEQAALDCDLLDRGSAPSRQLVTTRAECTEVSTPLPSVGPFAPAPAAVVDHPSRLGRYRVTGVLGQGGFAIAYRGFDEVLEREVAIKVALPERLQAPEDAELYLDEARVLAQLDHPHIVPVYDVGRTDAGLPFVVSKFIKGSDLAGRLKQARMTWTEAAALVATIAEALHYAHSRGLVHRDVKPANILLDTNGKPYLVDFGLALRDEDFGTGPTVAGTPAYMSPEQAGGAGHLAEGRSDIFSLGVVLYEAITGRRPFRSETTTDLLHQVRYVEPKPPRQIDDSIPKELERIRLKALAKRPSDRYTTAKDMADELRSLAEPRTQRSGVSGDWAALMRLVDQVVEAKMRQAARR